VSSPVEEPRENQGKTELRGLGWIFVPPFVGAVTLGLILRITGCDAGELGRLNSDASTIVGLIIGGIMGLIFGCLTWALFPYKRNTE